MAGYNSGFLPPYLTAEQAGGIDLGAAIDQGFKGYNQALEARYKPKNLAEELLAKQLQNRIAGPKAEHAEEITQSEMLAQNLANQMNAPKAKYAEDLTKADLEGIRARTGLSNLQIQQLQNSIAQNNAFNSALSNNGSSSNSGAMNANAQQSAADETASEPAKIIDPGNQNLYNIDKMYNDNPQFRKQLEARGFKRTQTSKYDPKTGTTTTITTEPSGKVSVKNSMNNSDYSQNTNAVKTQAQNVINGVDNAIPLIDKLIAETKKGNIPGQVIGRYFSPNQQADYTSTTNQSGDTLARAFTYPNTEGGLNQAKAMVARGPGESDAAYIKRLKNLKVDLYSRKNNAQKVGKKGTSLSSESSSDLSKLSDAELLKIASGAQ